MARTAHALSRTLAAALVASAVFATGCADHADHHHIPPEVEAAANAEGADLEIFQQALSGEFPGSNYIQSPNYTNASRKKGQVTVIVVHTIQGSYNGCISWFKNPKAKVSAHYVVSKGGAVTQMVKEEDIGWHVGSQNGYTIGIEHEGYVSDPKWVTTAMLDKSAKLTCYLTKKWGLPIDRKHIKGHVELPKQTHTDPGKHWPWNDYIARVKKHCGQGGGVVDPPKCGNCDDGNGCTKDTCVNGKCSHPYNNGAVCWDGNPCTVGEKCSSGKCVGGSLKSQCIDNNPCTKDSCNTKTGACVHTNVAGNCKDNNPCTDDKCDAKTGKCAFVPNKATCSDGNACTTGDKCSNGKCAAGTPMNCDDGNKCTVGDKCVGGTCVKGTPKQCGATGSCATGVCVPSTGLCNGTQAKDGTPCDDGSPCTAGDGCFGGVCKGQPIVCDDGNPCTNDACGAGGCYQVPNTMFCNDNNPCTLGDKCAGGVCTGKPMDCSGQGKGCNAAYCYDGKCVGGGKACNDNDPCTTDSCGDGVCKHEPNTGLCDDGKLCTAGDSCKGGVCVGQYVDCADNDPCTLDQCADGKCENTLIPECGGAPRGGEDAGNAGNPGNSQDSSGAAARPDAGGGGDDGRPDSGSGDGIGGASVDGGVIPPGNGVPSSASGGCTSSNRLGDHGGGVLWLLAALAFIMLRARRPSPELAVVDHLSPTSEPALDPARRSAAGLVVRHDTRPRPR